MYWVDGQEISKFTYWFNHINQSTDLTFIYASIVIVLILFIFIVPILCRNQEEN